jgi:hypothetical protein
MIGDILFIILGNKNAVLESQLQALGRENERLKSQVRQPLANISNIIKNK